MTHMLAELPISLNLTDTTSQGSTSRDITRQLGATWRRSIRSSGGCWQATADWDGESWELEEMFLEGLGRIIKEASGAQVSWQGFIGRMEYVKNGITYTRDWLDIANAIKVKYQKTSDNKLTNGSAESGAWASLGTPTTNAQSTAWRSHGTYSEHIITDAVSEGAKIGNVMPVIDNKAYDLSLNVKIISGTWCLKILNSDTAAELASVTEDTAGIKTLSCSIPDTNTIAGNTEARLVCKSAAGEIYADNGIYHDAPTNAETAWYIDADSIAELGRMETIIDETAPVEIKAFYTSTSTGKGKKKKTTWTVHYATDTAADALAQKKLKELAWPQTKPPDDYQFSTDKDKLSLVFYGDVYLLRNRYTILSGTDDATSQVAALVGESDFIDIGINEINAMDYQIDDSNPPRELDALTAIVDAGDSSGNRWIGGVFSNRLYDYKLAAAELSYHYRGGELLMMAGGPQEPWLAVPGYAEIDDMPVGPVISTTGNLQDDPRVVWIEEVEFDCADWLAGNSGLNFRRTAW